MSSGNPAVEPYWSDIDVTAANIIEEIVGSPTPGSVAYNRIYELVGRIIQKERAATTAPAPLVWRREAPDSAGLWLYRAIRQHDTRRGWLVSDGTIPTMAHIDPDAWEWAGPLDIAEPGR